MARKRSEVRLGSGSPRAVELCPSHTEEQSAGPMGLLCTQSLRRMNAPLFEVLVCPKVGRKVKGSQKS